MKSPRLPRPTWHPVLLALYPTLTLLARNTENTRLATARTPLLLSLGGVFVVWAVAGLLLRSRTKGAVWTSTATFLFFSHGHLWPLLGGGAVAGWLLVAAGVVGLGLLGRHLARRTDGARTASGVLDVVAVLLFAMAAIPVGKAELAGDEALPARARFAHDQAPLGYLPDIYIIILDAFGRADRLDEIYGVDLTPLEDHLRAQGFVVAERARANYSQTSLSLAALLNQDYVQDLLPHWKRTFSNRKDLNRIVRENRVVGGLRGKGYRLVSLASGSHLAEQADPDVEYSGGALNEFQATLVATTPLPLVLGLVGGADGAALDPYDEHRRKLRYQLAKLPHVAAEAGPKVIFAHVLAPHPPFVIGADGSDRRPDYKYNIGERYAWKDYVPNYAGQVTWLAGELQRTIDGILAASRRDPVILVMGDHGPASRWIAYWKRTDSFEILDRAILDERLPIFLALHLPDGDGGAVYADLTPVNVFALVFERIFGEPARLKPDRSYWSTYDRWSLFTPVDSLLGNPAPR